MEHTILENERLVYSVIRKFNYCDQDDLYQVGMMGLINAYKNYQNDKNTKFSTYAYFYILGEVKKFIRESLGITVSRDMQKLNLMIDKATILLTQKLMHCPSNFELATYLEIDEQDIEKAKEAKVIIDSLDNQNDEELTLYDKLGYQEEQYKEDYLDLHNEINNLDSFDREIINQRYFEDKTQQEIADYLGLTQVKVYRKEKEILTRLKERL